MAKFQNGLSDDEAKIRTYRNLVPAYRQETGDIKDQITNLQQLLGLREKQIEEMTSFLEDHGQVPKTMAEWSKDMGN
jgi:transcription initiation factor TFIID subunit TAF12